MLCLQKYGRYQTEASVVCTMDNTDWCKTHNSVNLWPAIKVTKYFVLKSMTCHTQREPDADGLEENKCQSHIIKVTGHMKHKMEE